MLARPAGSLCETSSDDMTAEKAARHGSSKDSAKDSALSGVRDANCVACMSDESFRHCSQCRSGPVRHGCDPFCQLPMFPEHDLMISSTGSSTVKASSPTTPATAGESHDPEEMLSLSSTEADVPCDKHANLMLIDGDKQRRVRCKQEPGVLKQIYQKSTNLSAAGRPSARNRSHNKRHRHTRRIRNEKDRGAKGSTLATADDICDLSSAAVDKQGREAVLERRLHTAVMANTKWQQKYNVETKANVELGRRVRSWKAAYLKEVDNREDVEKDLEDFCQASEIQADAYRKEIRRLAALLLHAPGRAGRPPSPSSHPLTTDAMDHNNIASAARVSNAGGFSRSGNGGGSQLGHGENDDAGGCHDISSAQDETPQSFVSSHERRRAALPGRGKRPSGSGMPPASARLLTCVDEVSSSSKRVTILPHTTNSCCDNEHTATSDVHDMMSTSGHTLLTADESDVHQQYLLSSIPRCKGIVRKRGVLQENRCSADTENDRAGPEPRRLCTRGDEVGRERKNERTSRTHLSSEQREQDPSGVPHEVGTAGAQNGRVGRRWRQRAPGWDLLGRYGNHKHDASGQRDWNLFNRLTGKSKTKDERRTLNPMFSHDKMRDTKDTLGACSECGNHGNTGDPLLKPCWDVEPSLPGSRYSKSGGISRLRLALQARSSPTPSPASSSASSPSTATEELADQRDPNPQFERPQLMASESGSMKYLDGRSCAKDTDVNLEEGMRCIPDDDDDGHADGDSFDAYTWDTVENTCCGDQSRGRGQATLAPATRTTRDANVAATTTAATKGDSAVEESRGERADADGQDAYFSFKQDKSDGIGYEDSKLCGCPHHTKIESQTEVSALSPPLRPSASHTVTDTSPDRSCTSKGCNRRSCSLPMPPQPMLVIAADGLKLGQDIDSGDSLRDRSLVPIASPQRRGHDIVERKYDEETNDSGAITEYLKDGDHVVIGSESNARSDAGSAVALNSSPPTRGEGVLVPCSTRGLHMGGGQEWDSLDVSDTDSAVSKKRSPAIGDTSFTSAGFMDGDIPDEVDGSCGTCPAALLLPKVREGAPEGGPPPSLTSGKLHGSGDCCSHSDYVNRDGDKLQRDGSDSAGNDRQPVPARRRLRRDNAAGGGGDIIHDGDAGDKGSILGDKEESPAVSSTKPQNTFSEVSMLSDNGDTSVNTGDDTSLSVNTSAAINDGKCLSEQKDKGAALGKNENVNVTGTPSAGGIERKPTDAEDQPHQQSEGQRINRDLQQQEQESLKPRIVELFRASFVSVSSTEDSGDESSTVLSSSSPSSSSSSSSLSSSPSSIPLLASCEMQRNMDEKSKDSAQLNDDERKTESWSISVGSNDDASDTDTYAELMQVSGGSTDPSDVPSGSQSPGDRLSFATPESAENYCGPVCGIGESGHHKHDIKANQRDQGRTSQGREAEKDVDAGFTITCVTGDKDCRRDDDNVADHGCTLRTAGQDEPRLFESIISVGIPSHWDLHPISEELGSSGSAYVRDDSSDQPRTKGRAARSRSTDNGTGNNRRGSRCRSVAGVAGVGPTSWIRSVFSSASSAPNRGSGSGGMTPTSGSRSEDASTGRTLKTSSRSSSSRSIADAYCADQVGVANCSLTPSLAIRADRGKSDDDRGHDEKNDEGQQEDSTPVRHGIVPGRLAPQVLERYPPNSNLPCENVADYCFPQGVQASPMDMRSSQSGLHKVRCLHEAGPCSQGDHGFRGAGEVQSHRMYGICVTYPKVVRCRLRSVAAASDKNEVAATGTSAKAGQLGRKPPNDGFGGSGSGAAGASRPRSRRARRGSDVESGGEGKEVQVWGCYCLLSRLPFFDLHFQVLWDLLAAERIERMRMTAARSDCITRAEELSEAVALASHTRTLLNRISQRYMGLTVPNPGQIIRLAVHTDLPEIRYERRGDSSFTGGLLPQGSDAVSETEDGKDKPPLASHAALQVLSPLKGVTKEIHSYDSFAGLRGDATPLHVIDGREMVDAVAAWALPGTLSAIPVDTLLAVVGALMCDFQVIVVSENLGLLSSVVLALAALTRPLLWEHPLVPVMPIEMGEILSAPVPYLIGTPRLEGVAGDRHDLTQLTTGQVILDADNNTVRYARPEDAASTALPRSRALLARLAPLAKILSDSHHTAETGKPIELATGSQAAASEVVQATVAAHVSSICASALKNYDTIIISTGATATSCTPRTEPNADFLQEISTPDAETYPHDTAATTEGGIDCSVEQRKVSCGLGSVVEGCELKGLTRSDEPTKKSCEDGNGVDAKVKAERGSPGERRQWRGGHDVKWWALRNDTIAGEDSLKDEDEDSDEDYESEDDGIERIFGTHAAHGGKTLDRADAGVKRYARAGVSARRRQKEAPFFQRLVRTQAFVVYRTAANAAAVSVDEECTRRRT